MGWVWPTIGLHQDIHLWSTLGVRTSNMFSHSSIQQFKIDVKNPWFTQERSPSGGCSLVFIGFLPVFYVQFQATCSIQDPSHPTSFSTAGGPWIVSATLPVSRQRIAEPAAAVFKAWLSQARTQSPSWCLGTQPFKNGKTTYKATVFLWFQMGEKQIWWNLLILSAVKFKKHSKLRLHFCSITDILGFQLIFHTCPASNFERHWTISWI